MAYQFKLEALRRFREFEEERLQKELADAQRVEEQVRTVLNEHIAMRQKIEGDFRKTRQSGEETAGRASMYRSYLQRLAGEIVLHHSKVQNAEKVCADARDALLAAMKRRKALDRLKEKGEQAFLAELNSEEQKFISEMAINRYTLKQE
ncbi:MAG: flagellar export protein FliJ [Desulfatitalea sp.]